MTQHEHRPKGIATKIREFFVKPCDAEENAQIAKRAYEIYEQRGRKDGLSDQDWLQAEREIKKKRCKK